MALTTTEFRPIGNNGEKIRATYGIDYAFGERNNQAPYFSITADIVSEFGRDIGGGCCHEDIAKAFPELAYLIPWHLTAVGKGPMHYVANAAYWAEKVAGISEWEAKPYDPNPFEAFKSTVTYGKVSSDKLTTERTIREWGKAAKYNATEVLGLFASDSNDTRLADREVRARFAHYSRAWCLARASRLESKFMRAMAQAEVLK